MSGTSHLEMKIVDLNDKVAKLNHEVATLKKLVEHLCERITK